MISFKYKHAALGGTFDHLHVGHKRILATAFERARQITVGITEDSFVKQKVLPQSIESFELRKKTVKDYLVRQNLLSRAKIISLQDIYGPTLTDKSLDAIVVTSKTLAGARRINATRHTAHIPMLNVFIASLVKGDDNKIISSERIRIGEIDREGKSYMRFWNKKNILTLPDSLRDELRKPLGKVFKSNQNNISKTTQKLLNYIKTNHPFMIITVGDIITNSLIQNRLNPDISIVDQHFGKNRAQHSTHILKNALFVRNDPGTITRQTALIIQKARNAFLKTGKNQQIVIEGEEDLAALPAIMLCPLYSLVVYGQWNLGIIATLVTEETKKKASTLLAQFI